MSLNFKIKYRLPLWGCGFQGWQDASSDFTLAWWEVLNKHPDGKFWSSFSTNIPKQHCVTFVVKTFDLPSYSPLKFILQCGLIFRYHKHPVLLGILWLPEKLWAISKSHTFYCLSPGIRFIYIGIFSEWSWLSILSPEFLLACGDSQTVWGSFWLALAISAQPGSLWEGPCPFMNGHRSFHSWLCVLIAHLAWTVPKQCFKIFVHIMWLFLLQFLFFFIVGSGDSPLEDDEVEYSHTRYKGECFACVLMRTCWCQENFPFCPAEQTIIKWPNNAFKF